MYDLEKSAPLDRSQSGPFDVLELTGIKPYIDMGSVRIEPREGLQVRLDVDQQAKRIIAISLDFEESSIQVQAFAAPKSSGLWLSIREELLKQLEAQAGDVVDQVGTFGKEIIATIKTRSEDSVVERRVRFIGVDGPRWTLRGAITGKAVDDEKAAADVESIFRSLVVVRGDQPMPPNELLPLKVPAGAQTKGN